MNTSLLAVALGKVAPLTLVDIGASGGPTGFWRKLGPNVRAVLFEPDPRAYQELQQKLPANVVLLNSALSDSRKCAQFHLCRNQEVSSVLRPNRDFLGLFGGAERFDVEKILEVKVDTLDYQLRDAAITSVDFIKIDTEGYEWPILQGANNTLSRTLGLQIEVAFVPMHHDQVLFCRINEHLNSQGFQLMDLRRCYWRRDTPFPTNGKGQLIWADALYFRSPEALVALPGFTVDRLVHGFVLYHLFGYTDLAAVLLANPDCRNLLGRESLTEFEALQRSLANDWRVPPFRGRSRIAKLARVFAAWLIADTAGQEDKTLGNLDIYSC